jgi:NADPH-dependent 2,4-dienoyl-CoA reductase/sulfur reductase-like enzyme
MIPTIEVAIIGAGPYGLSLAAHLAAAGVDARVFGRPMHSWRSNMPEGMLLKSDPFASNLSDPQDFYSLARYSAERAIEYSEAKPVRLDVFCDYGLAFQKRFVPDLKELSVTAVERNDGVFALQLENGAQASARRLVVAIGVGPFRYVPEPLSGLADRYASHSFDHHDLSRFVGARVAVIGGGSSAIDLAGLLHERGCDATLVSRRAALKFSGVRTSARPSLWRRIRHPSSGLGPGLRSRFSTDAPLIIHAMPKRLRLEFVRRHLGPAASGVMKDRVIGRVPLLLGRQLIGAAVAGDGVALTLGGQNGQREALHVDHVIAATGFRTDIRRLDFLSAPLREEIADFEHTPVLSRYFESSVPGLYFIGPAAAVSFGPMMRFAFGARYVARRMTRALARCYGAQGSKFSEASAVGMTVGNGV